MTEESPYVIPDDPALGKYLKHYTTHRLRLLVQGGTVYVLAVIGLQILFLGVDRQTASVILPIAFASIAGGIFWYMAHLWNREVVVYEKGFTYRQGSRVGVFRYEQIVRLRVRAERLSLAGLWRRDVYDCLMTSEHDEVLRLNNTYGDIARLLNALEQAITQARLPVARAQLAQGQKLSFGVLEMDNTGLATADAVLLWQDFQGYKVADGNLVFEGWQSVPLAEVDNLRLLVVLLKERR